MEYERDFACVATAYTHPYFAGDCRLSPIISGKCGTCKGADLDTSRRMHFVLFQATVVIPGVVINRAVWLTTRIIDSLGKQSLLPSAAIWT
jgi:hypothetical protein